VSRRWISPVPTSVIHPEKRHRARYAEHTSRSNILIVNPLLHRCVTR
jgi:hypothetical protein